MEEPLSDADADFLSAYGGPHVKQILTEDPEQAAQRLTIMAVRSTTWAVSDSMSIADAAQLLGVDRSRISQLLSSGRLWAFQLGRSRRLPRWQFVGSGRLPGLETVVPAIPDGLAPQSIAGFMKTPQSELDDSSPTDWLAGGGDPEVVATLLADLGRW